MTIPFRACVILSAYAVSWSTGQFGCRSWTDSPWAAGATGWTSDGEYSFKYSLETRDGWKVYFMAFSAGWREFGRGATHSYRDLDLPGGNAR